MTTPHQDDIFIFPDGEWFCRSECYPPSELTPEDREFLVILPYQSSVYFAFLHRETDVQEKNNVPD